MGVILFLRGQLAMSETVLVVKLGEECYWQLVSRDQGCAKYPTMHRASLSPSTKNYLAQNVDSAKCGERVLASSFQALDLP